MALFLLPMRSIPFDVLTGDDPGYPEALQVGLMVLIVVAAVIAAILLGRR